MIKDQFNKKWNTEVIDAFLVSFTGFQSDSMELTDLERSMVLEAKKTAEYHDSDNTLNREAAHIANILKTSPYAIVFTGNFMFY